VDKAAAGVEDAAVVEQVQEQERPRLVRRLPAVVLVAGADAVVVAEPLRMARHPDFQTAP